MLVRGSKRKSTIITARAADCDAFREDHLSCVQISNSFIARFPGQPSLLISNSLLELSVVIAPASSMTGTTSWWQPLRAATVWSSGTTYCQPLANWSIPQDCSASKRCLQLAHLSCWPVSKSPVELSPVAVAPSDALPGLASMIASGYYDNFQTAATVSWVLVHCLSI